MATPWSQQLALPASYNAPDWSELKTPDGRSYFYNSRTAQTTWEKPDALKTPAEQRLAKIPWKEYQTPEGRKYWNNKDTGESVWSMPQAYKDAVNGPKANGYAHMKSITLTLTVVLRQH
jgi:pre-mRNA-processing factor 40